MIVKGIVDEDLSNYKKPSMLIATARCSMKCDELNGCHVCQNSPLIFKEDINISNEELIKRYEDNRLTQAIIFGGLEPLDQFAELVSFIRAFRMVSLDTIVIYTGYTDAEARITGQRQLLAEYPNIIVKWGRYIMNCEPHEDKLLGVMLASPNQYAERIS